MLFEQATQRAKKLLGKVGEVQVLYNSSGPNKTDYCLGYREEGNFVRVSVGKTYEDAITKYEATKVEPIIAVKHE